MNSNELVEQLLNFGILGDFKTINHFPEGFVDTFHQKLDDSDSSVITRSVTIHVVNEVAIANFYQYKEIENGLLALAWRNRSGTHLRFTPSVNNAEQGKRGLTGSIRLGLIKDSNPTELLLPRKPMSEGFLGLLRYESAQQALYQSVAEFPIDYLPRLLDNYQPSYLKDDWRTFIELNQVYLPQNAIQAVDRGLVDSSN